MTPGPFTVFAPVNKAFDKLPAGTVDTLLKPENKATLTAVLTYHVVPGNFSAKDLKAKIKEGGGKAMLKTVEGDELTFMLKGSKIEIMDAKGGMSMVTIPNVFQSMASSTWSIRCSCRAEPRVEEPGRTGRRPGFLSTDQL